MTDFLAVEHNIETNEIIEREMTAEEMSEIDRHKAEIDSNKELAKTKAAQKTQLLTRLGITEDEARLLLG